MIFPTTAPAGCLVSLEGNLSRALDVFYGLPLLLPQERLAAASMLHQFARDRFGISAPETQGMQSLHQSLSENGGVLRDKAALESVFTLWRRQENEQDGFDVDLVTRTHTVAPLFNAGGVRFFQSPDATIPLRSGEIPDMGTLGGGYLLSNERNFQRYFDDVRGLGGVTVGLGSLQNLDLAVAAGASGLILADISPTVSMTLALLLPQLARCNSPEDFQNASERLIRRDTPMEPFVELIPEGYRPAFEAHLDTLRHSVQYPKLLRKLVMRSMLNPHSFLGSRESFERAVDLAVRGGITLVYGNFFGEHMPNVIELAMEAYNDPVRIINATNAPEQVVARKYPVSAGPFLSILEGPKTDPRGRFLMSTEFGRNKKWRPGEVTAGVVEDPFLYHGVPIRAASILLRTYGHLMPFVRRFEMSQGL